MPLDLFTSGKALWLGVQPQLSAMGEQSRVLLVAVPYALKAADADTLGGKPASAYVATDAASAPASTVTAAAGAAATGLQALSQTAPVTSVSRPAADTGPLSPSCSTITADGTASANFLAKFTAACVLHQSAVFENSGNVGIGNTSPAGKLDVSGNTFIRGTLQLPATGKATGSTGFDSQPLDSLASAFDSSTHAAVSQHFRWQAEPVGNNTSSPSGKFNLLFASGTGTPAETGVSLSATGNLTGKQLVSTAATGTAPLVVSSTTQVTNLNASQLGGLASSAFAKVGGANTFNGSQSVTGNVSATKQLISTVATGTAPLSVSSTTQVPNLNASLLGGQPASAFALLNGTNTFTRSNTMNGQLAVAGNGVYTYVGDPGCGSGWAGIEFNGFGGCNTYSIIGNGTDTLLNRPLGGAMRFRENNADEIIIVAGGQVGIGTQTPGAQLDVEAPSNSGLHGGLFNGGAQGGDGVIATGGSGAYGVNASGGNGANGGDGVIAYGAFPNSGSGGSGGNGMTAIAGGSSTGTAGAGIDATGGDSSNAQAGAGIRATGGNSINGQGGDGIFAVAGSGIENGYAGLFSGDVDVVGNLSKNGGSFKIDHPLDPANKYLYHSFVESPDMMNIYNGVVVLDGSGEAVVELPEWFGALNRDFRYQLTAVGSPGPDLYIAQEIENNSFRIAGGKPGLKVSWQVTGIRQDAWANAHRIPVEVEKSERERGYYLHPELYGAPEEKGMEWARHPEMMRWMKARQAKAPSQSTKP